MKLGENFGKALGGFGRLWEGFGSSWEGDRPSARPPDRLYVQTPDQPPQRPHILRELALAYRRKYRMSCVHVRVGSFGAITRVCEMG